ncbi:MAG: SMI1/KNR4 family protein [Coriobacteriales bacterium]|jgi:hypothetical protein|nr:SMI1/KNR4 family protein [Coriobacteriales bacterium]
MNSQITEWLSMASFNPPATEEAISAVEAEMGIRFPTHYRDFMLESNGAEGGVGAISYLSIWPVESIASLNKAAKVDVFTPGLVYFASNGGGTTYAFDKRDERMPIVEISDYSIHIEEAILLGDTFIDFIEYLFNAE